MPTYDYKCDNCDHQFEFYQSMKDEKKTTCPKCGKNTLKRLIGSGAGLIFKGSGFYLTDYKKKSTETLVNTSSDTDNKKTESAPASVESAKSDANTPASSDKVNGSGEKKSSDTKSENKKTTKPETKSTKKTDDQ